MTTDKDLQQQLIELAWEIEKLPASEQQTKVITMLTDIRIRTTPSPEQRGESEVRRILWEKHSCPLKYGDDGEMQCGACIIDFKRDSLESIIDKGFRRQPAQVLDKSSLRVIIMTELLMAVDPDMSIKEFPVDKIADAICAKFSAPVKTGVDEKRPDPEGIGVITCRSGFVSNSRAKICKETGYDIHLSEKEWDCLWHIACKIDGVYACIAAAEGGGQ